MKRLITVFFNFIVFFYVEAQNLEQTILFGNEQFKEGNYESAIAAYQRVLFFYPQNNNTSDIYNKLGKCYYELNSFEKAAGYFDMTFFSNTNDSIRKEAIFNKISCLLLMQNYSFALMDLLSLEENLPVYFEKKRNLYLGITWFGLNKFDSSETYFLKCIEDTHVVTKNHIRSIFVKNSKLKAINPTTAKVLSMFIPGLGQLYAGDVKNAVNSFILSSIFLAITIKVANTYSIIDAAVSVFPWYQRYYMGGFKKAELIAKSTVSKKRANLYKELIDSIASVKK